MYPIEPKLSRRRVLGGAFAAGGVLALGGCASVIGKAKPQVVIIGAGYGGATAAKYLSTWGAGTVDVTVIDRQASFISCPISNLVIGGSKQMSDITVGYDGLRRRGVRVLQAEVTAIDAERREVRLDGGRTLPYDRLIVSPGVELMSDQIPNLRAAEAEGRILSAWKAGPQTMALRRQLEAMPDGGVFAITVPLAPYRCPPGPYERACQVASYFQQHKPRAKVLILDANPDVTSKAALFKKAWAELYPGMVEYQGNNALAEVDPRTLTAKLQLEDVRADVLNVLPPMRAGEIARSAGLVNANQRWCAVDWLTMESTAAKNIHVLGDATLAAPAMPKSGHMANQHAKVAAAAILNAFAGLPPNPTPVVMNTCYSFVAPDKVIHVASVHQFNAEKKTFETVPGSGGVSAAANELEATYALSWATNIWADSLS
jgi:sulfide dehydrogenase [flavocytochrome c] flavoprotein chain